MEYMNMKNNWHLDRLFGWVGGWLIAFTPCQLNCVNLYVSQFNNYALQMYIVQKCIFTIIFNIQIPHIYSQYHWVKNQQGNIRPKDRCI